MGLNHSASPGTPFLPFELNDTSSAPAQQPIKLAARNGVCCFGDGITFMDASTSGKPAP
jgi:hypothetical protein